MPTGRAALLAMVICAIMLSLAYSVREYIAQRQQIDQLLAQQQTRYVSNCYSQARPWRWLPIDKRPCEATYEAATEW